MSTAAQTRAAGFYWVKFGGEWIVAEWHHVRGWPGYDPSVVGVWFQTMGDNDDGRGLPDDAFAEIDERRTERHPSPSPVESDR